MRVQRQATHAMWQVQAIRSANVRADAIVFNSALSAYARNRPPLRTPARKLPRDMQRWGFPPTTVSYCELQTLRRNLALAACRPQDGRGNLCSSCAVSVPSTVRSLSNTRGKSRIRAGTRHACGAFSG